MLNGHLSHSRYSLTLPWEHRFSCLQDFLPMVEIVQQPPTREKVQCLTLANVLKSAPAESMFVKKLTVSEARKVYFSAWMRSVDYWPLAKILSRRLGVSQSQYPLQPDCCDVTGKWYPPSEVLMSQSRGNP